MMKNPSENKARGTSRMRYLCMCLAFILAGTGVAVATQETFLAEEDSPVARVGSLGYATLAEAVSAAQASETVEVLVAGTYTLPGLPRNITIEGAVEGVVFSHTGSGNIASVPNGATFKNVTFNFGNENYHGFQQAGLITMDGCTINGKFFSYGDMNFTGCQFVQDNADYHMWVYGKGTVNYTNCTFTNNATGKFLHLYSESSANVGNVTVTGCTFINNSGSASKAAINVKATSGTTMLNYTVSVSGDCTTEGAFPAPGVRDNADHTDVISPLIQVDDRTGSAASENIIVEQDNVVVYDSGSEVEVVEISTVAELKAFRDAVNSGTYYNGKIVRLTADLDLGNEDNWTPIGNLVSYPGQSFHGTFDGAGHTIAHLKVDDSTPNYAVAGLFGSIAEGSIVNLTLTDVNIKSTHYAAGIVAYTSNAPSIINCHVIGGTITSTPELLGGSYDNGDKAGGIMGYCTTGTTIKDCSVEGLTVRAYRDLAGICGYAGGSVSDCTVTDVTVIQDNTNAYKTEDQLSTACAVVGGRSANASQTNTANTTENVSITSAGNGVAQIGTTKYETLAEAVAAANDGETITLLADCTGNGIKVPQGKFPTGLTIDFAGHTYTVDGEAVGSTGTETQAFQLLKENTITLKNGTVVANSTDVKMMIQNYSNLTLDGMTLDATQGTNSVNYVLSTNNGTTVINNTTITAKSTGIAFDVDSGWGNYASNSVEVTGTSVINGNIEVAFEGKTAGTPSVLTLTSGTINGGIVMGTGADECTVTKASSFTQAAPEGYKWVENGDDTSTLAPKVYVAQIGSTKYETLAEAVAAVPTDGTPTTITMIASEAINVVGSAITIPANKNIILDLNGYQVVGTAESGSTSALITNKGTLTIKDSSDTHADGTGTGQLISGATPTWVYDGSGNYAGSYASNTITNTGTLTIQSGYIENLSTGSATYAVDNNSSGADAILNVQGGLLKARAVAVRQFANSTVKENTVNVTGGTIQAGYSGIWIQLPGSNADQAVKATLNVSGGNLTGGSYAFYDYSYGNNFNATQYNLSGGTYNGDVFSFGANIDITDGTYNGDVIIKQEKSSNVSVSGGRFAADVYTYGSNASEGFITGGVFKAATYEDNDQTYEYNWIHCLAEQYIDTDNTNVDTKEEYPYTAKTLEDAGIYLLIDGEPYERTTTVAATEVTYRRTFKDGQVGKYQAWFVPFDYTIKNEDAENFTFYKIDFVSHSPLSGVVEDNSAVFINIEALSAGKTLKGNRPYLVKPTKADTFDFVAENVNLLGIDESSRLKMSTSAFEYNFYGNYGTYSTSSDHELLAMNGGQICWNTAGAKLGSYRWLIKAISNFGDDDYSKIRFIIIGDEEDNLPTAIDDVNTVDDAIDAYYTVDGMKLEFPAKGLNIVKYKSGRTKKVFIQ